MLAALIPGRATPAATAELARHRPLGGCDARGLRLSAVGLGTSLADGDPRLATLGRVVGQALRSGINVIDCAPNYGAQRCERAVGRALARACARGQLTRDSVFIVSKGGFAPAASPGAPALALDAFQLAGDERRGDHSLAPRWLDALIARSRANLGLATIDLYLLHNPELHAPLGPRRFAQRMRAAFATLERACADGRIGAYGVATWSAFRVPRGHGEALQLTQLLAWAREVGGVDHRFVAVEAPYNLAWPELARARTQRRGARRRGSLLQVARDHSLLTLASAPLLQGALARPGVLTGGGERGWSGAQRALEAVLATAGIDIALVGMRSARHVAESVAVLAERV